MKKKIYLNNGASTWPKPKEVAGAVEKSLRAFPDDRKGDAARRCSERLAELLGVSNPEQVVITPSATYGINIVVRGLLSLKGNAIATVIEHNSVIRPLEQIRSEREADISYVPQSEDGIVSLEELNAAIDDETALVALSHVSNVTGCVQPMKEAAEICAERGIPLLIDAAQSAGCVPIDYDSIPGRVFIAVAGHKALYGPRGTGALVVPDNELPVLFSGGTGIEEERLTHPESLPVKYEVGTKNSPGIEGLIEGVNYILSEGVNELGGHRASLAEEIREGFKGLDGITLMPSGGDDMRPGIVSFRVEGYSAGDFSQRLDEEFGVVAKGGIQNAPLIHESLGNGLDGCVRVSVGAFNNNDDVSELIGSVSSLLKSD